MFGLPVATPALAQSLADHVYLGFEFGLLDYTGSAGDYERALRRRGHAVDVYLDTHGPAFHGYVGYSVCHYASLELGWANLGSFDARFTGTTANVDALVDDIRDLQPVAGQGPTLSLRLTPALTRSVKANLRVGGFYRTGGDGDIRINGRRVGHIDYDRAVVFGGAGLQFKLAEALSLVPQVTVFDLGPHDPSLLYSMSLVYALGGD